MAEGSISAFDFHVHHYGLHERQVFGEEGMIPQTGPGGGGLTTKTSTAFVLSLCFVKHISSLLCCLTHYLSSNKHSPWSRSQRVIVCEKALRNKFGVQLNTQSWKSCSSHAHQSELWPLQGVSKQPWLHQLYAHPIYLRRVSHSHQGVFF